MCIIFLIPQALPQLEIQKKRFESDSRNIKNTIKDTLNQLTSASLTELRALNKPENEVEEIIIAVIMLREYCKEVLATDWLSEVR